MVLSYESRFAFQIQESSPQFTYPSHFYQMYRSLHQRQTLVEIVALTEDLSSYRLVVAPALHVLPKVAAEILERFVPAGGLLLVTPRTGVKDEADSVVNRRLPGLLAELCGTEVGEYDSLPADVSNQLAFTLPELASAPPASARVWCDVVKPTAATVVARYTQDYYVGKPAITRNQVGRGWVVYVGTMSDVPLYETLARWLLDSAAVQPVLDAPEGIEVAERWQQGK